MTNSDGVPPAGAPGSARGTAAAPLPDATRATARARKKAVRQRVVVAVMLAIIGAFFAAAWYFTRSNADNAKVGDCVAAPGENSVKIVACDDPTAAFKVVGRVQDKTQSEALIDACAPYQSLGADQVYWQGKAGQTGLVLCLASLNK